MAKMSGKLRILLFALTVFLIWKGAQYLPVFQKTENVVEEPMKAQAARSKENKVTVTLYYEALCSDSRNFVIAQLIPTYNSLRDFIHIDFVPYGKAKTIEENGEITFQCQHAAVECLANKVHACGLEFITDPDLQLKYVSCMIVDNMAPHVVGERCARELNIAYEPILECANGSHGSHLLKEYGIRTHAANPTITFIPTIELDGSQKVPLAHILKNLQKEVCNLFKIKPKPCSANNFY